MELLPNSLSRILMFLQMQPDTLVSIADFYLKSFLLVGLACYLDLNASPFFSSAQKRLLWIVTLVLLAFLPASSFVVNQLIAGASPEFALNLLVVVVPGDLMRDGSTSGTPFNAWFLAVLVVYMIVLAGHSLKLGLSFRYVYQVRCHADYNLPEHIEGLFMELCIAAKVRPNVRLGVSSQVDSPVTFGVLKPVVIVPDKRYFDDVSLLRNVVTHELSHVKRHDTATYVGAYALSALNWFNPFIWMALRKLSLEAEFACDDDVIRSKDDRFSFAGQLLKIASLGLTRESPSLAQSSILTRSQLARRVEHILRGGNGINSERNYSSGAPVSALLVAFALFSGANVLAPGDESSYLSEDLRLVHFQAPVYPARAIDIGVTGFSQYRFDVDAFGKVDSGSIRLLRSSRGALFDESSIQALESFRFAPRKVNGRSVATNDVRYTFYYEMRF